MRAKGGLFLEAPVSGSTGPAAQGQLIFLTAGTWGTAAGPAVYLACMHPAEPGAQRANKTALPAHLARAPSSQGQQCNATRVLQTRSLPSPGDEALFQAAAGPLDVMGKAKFFLGEVGAGANMKLVRAWRRARQQNRAAPACTDPKPHACAGLRNGTSRRC